VWVVSIPLLGDADDDGDDDDEEEDDGEDC